MENNRFLLEDILTASTASKFKNIPYSTLKGDLTRYNKFKSQIERGLVKKEGKVWLITKQALNEVYGTD